MRISATLARDIERVLDRLSASQVDALAAAAQRLGRPSGSLDAAVAGAQPSARDAVTKLAAGWRASENMTGAGVALALRTGLRARQASEATRSRPVWTGPCTSGEQRLTAGVLHELIVGAQRRILLVSFAAHTLASVAADLELAVGRGCAVDVVFETEADSAGAYSAHGKPFGGIQGISRWRWPPGERPQGALLHAKALVVDGRRALIGSANLTHRALHANLEVGVLIRDPGVAAAFEEHVRELMARGVLALSE